MPGEELIQGERASLQGPAVVAGHRNLFLSGLVEAIHVDPLAHRGREPLRRVPLEGRDLAPPVPGRLAFRPAMHLEQMNQREAEIALDRIQL